MQDEAHAEWVEQRRQAAAGHGAALAAARTAEAERARALIADFVREAAAHGVRPEPLFARSVDGRSTYRTQVHGWYLRSDRSVAVGADGAFYVLMVPGSWLARLRGATLTPSEPRLVLGAGAGDGESMPLQELLRRRLSGGYESS